MTELSTKGGRIKHEKHPQKHSSYQIWDIAFLYTANYQNIYYDVFKRLRILYLVTYLVVARTIRLENDMMVERGDKNTFGDQAHDICKNLPKAIRVIKDS